MFEFLGGLATSILGGGVTGILGVIAQRYFDLRNKRLDAEMARDKYSQEVALRRIDYDIMEKEWIGRVQVAEVEGAAKSDVAESQAFAASFNEPVRYSDGVKPSAGQAWALVILDFFRAIIRPGLTVYLSVLTTLIYMHANQIASSMPMKPEDAAELLRLVIGTILYLFTTCLLWWFGVRHRGKAPSIK